MDKEIPIQYEDMREEIKDIRRRIEKIEKEINRLEKELDKWEKEVALVQRKLSNEGFVAKAPQQLVAKEKEKLVDYEEKRSNVEARLQELKTQQ